VQYTEEDVRCALYAQNIDAMNIGQYDGTRTPRQVIYSEEAELFHGCVKSEEEVLIDRGDGYSEMGFITEEWDLHKPEDEKVFLEKCVHPQLARYERGKAILESQELIFSTPWMAGAENGKREKMIQRKKVTSPAIDISVGYIHTTEHYKWVVLAERKKVTQ